MLLVSDYFLDFYKPETAWDVPGFKCLKTHPVLHLEDIDFDEQEHIGSSFKQISYRLEYPQIVFEEEMSVICCASFYTISGVSLTVRS